MVEGLTVVGAELDETVNLFHRNLKPAFLRSTVQDTQQSRLGPGYI